MEVYIFVCQMIIRWWCE